MPGSPSLSRIAAVSLSVPGALETAAGNGNFSIYLAHLHPIAWPSNFL
jgi:hypothetical protein